MVTMAEVAASEVVRVEVATAEVAAAVAMAGEVPGKVAGRTKAAMAGCWMVRAKRCRW
jgi:hypothetical protein